ncbi:ATP-dependent Clp protease proteolytic subunit-related protein 3, chloroplastic [Glycine soja]|uniref:ATP-dependent Clp protease proteolytic subunit-related protein 3, chloroplastic n=1 Tax=Glycine soja TaxID=3848 RepID=A0A445LQY0_GLYSO|nr:ATP-dependent Clp protease proteolytic subunit-related protein 3, chloroplastic [Glycine soja]
MAVFESQLVSTFIELVIAKLMYLEYMDPKDPIYIYKNSTRTTRDDGEMNAIWPMQHPWHFPKVLEFLTVALRLTLFSTLGNAILWYMRHLVSCRGFYRRFIQDFSKIALLLSKLLQQDVDFVFYQPCKEAFEELRKKFTTSPILQPLDWELPFVLMCNASSHALGDILS